MTFNYLLHAYQAGRDIIFDLDNTLYPETNFLFRAYDEIANKLYPDEAEAVSLFLQTNFTQNGRQHLFDKMIMRFPNDGLTIDIILEVLRNSVFENSLSLYPWFLKFCQFTDDKFVLRVITNGNARQQKNKIKSLKWPATIHTKEFIFADEHEAKPNTASFKALTDWDNLTDPLYVGDSAVDKSFADALGISFLPAQTLIVDRVDI